MLGNLANAITALPTSVATSAELYARAVEYGTQALAIAEELDFAGGRADALTVLGNAATLLGDPRVAVQRQQEALAIARTADNVLSTATILVNLGDAYRAMGEGELASAAYEEGVRMFEGLNDAYGLARACWRYGELVIRLHEVWGRQLTLDEAQRAVQLWKRAVELERAHNLPTVQEHVEKLGVIQRWVAHHSGAPGKPWNKT